MFPVHLNISDIHTRSSRDCGRPFGEHAILLTLLASCFGLASFCGVLAPGVDGVLLATCSRALRIYISKWTFTAITYHNYALITSDTKREQQTTFKFYL